MIPASNKSWVCWRCVSRLGSDAVVPRSPHARPRGPTGYGTLSFGRHLATVRHPGSAHDASGTSYPTQKNDKPVETFRQRLRRWEAENPKEDIQVLPDDSEAGSLSNTLTRPQNVTMAQFTVQDSRPIFAGDELGDLRSDDATLSPGDMVELSAEHSRRPVLAISLGRINGYEHYYGSSGKWFSAMGVKPLFVVPGFATAEELAPVIAELPTEGASIETLNILQDLGGGPSRTTGAALLRNMLQFIQDAEEVYQANAGTLDASSAFIGDPVKHRYLTLHEIADLLLPETSKKKGKFNTSSLYAVHRALMEDEVFFRPLRSQGHNRSYLFEVSPLSEVRTVQKVESWLRGYLNNEFHPQHTPSDPREKSPIKAFISTAQGLIDETRKSREWSKNGIIGPSSQKWRETSSTKWSETDKVILEFIELWASYRKFPAYSRLQTFGSALMRALGRYEEYLPATGWTFLQEVRWIPPWEIPARYSVRFPDVEIKRGGSYVRPYMGMLDRHLKRDALSLIRKPLEGATVYCIDDITAHEIDDAVSLERTSNPEEYWIHVHVADPASSFAADTPVAKYAELIPEAIYLPGHLEPMLPAELIHDRFSLAAGRPCLTFSALVKTDGTILGEKVTPNTLKDVIYMTYEDAALSIGERRLDPYSGGARYQIGTSSKKPVVNREMSGPGDLAKDQKEDLAILSKLGKAIQGGRLAKGATPFFQSRAMVTTNFSEVKQKNSEDFITTSGDPTIEVHYSPRSGTDLVENAMKLANEVAARWCWARDIPIPYRTQPHGLRNAALIQQYAHDVLNPLLESGVAPDDAVWKHMRSLIGSDEVSTTPAPHFTLGVDMYTKATSPLRRFGDLIVHWQVEAALLEEARLKRSLINTDKSAKTPKHEFLPFTRETLDRMLPLLRVREKQARTLTNIDGPDQWILQALVRAWRFKEAPLPETFKMTVWHITATTVLGRLDWFDRSVVLKHEALNGVALGTDIRLDDVIEVRLTDVNVYSRRIQVEAVRMIKKAEDTKKEAPLPLGQPEGPPETVLV
ncbi:hypothetical protein F5Y18DRAFT_395862 [Xylariaceae sp. FL1019]|nr:hypothetical protein F5Y18DRAFT_395862 [Xylariaceae sp. FL1019]